MATMTRIRFKNHETKWTESGPSMLRKPDNAYKVLAGAIGTQRQGRLVSRTQWEGGWTNWSKPTGKFYIMENYRDWKKGKDTLFQVGVIRDGKEKNPHPIFDCKAEVVHLLKLPDVHQGCNVAWSLAKHQFRDLEFGGGFVCKNSDPGYTSNHAWKDAVDETPPNGSYNEALFRWNMAMAAGGHMNVDQIIGSIDGRVVNCSAPDWNVSIGGADNSHLWHNHVSVIDHHGADSPYCSGS